MPKSEYCCAFFLYQRVLIRCVLEMKLFSFRSMFSFPVKREIVLQKGSLSKIQSTKILKDL